MFHFDNLLSAKLCVDEQGKNKSLKVLLYSISSSCNKYASIILESQLLIFLASKAL